MAEFKERLLPLKPASAMNLREAAAASGYRSLSAAGSQNHLFHHGVNIFGLKKRGQGLRSCIRVDSSGNSLVIEVDKFTMMRRCDLPTRDLPDPRPSVVLRRRRRRNTKGWVF